MRVYLKAEAAKQLGRETDVFPDVINIFLFLSNSISCHSFEVPARCRTSAKAYGYFTGTQTYSNCKAVAIWLYIYACESTIQNYFPPTVFMGSVVYETSVIMSHNAPDGSHLIKLVELSRFPFFIKLWSLIELMNHICLIFLVVKRIRVKSSILYFEASLFTIYNNVYEH